MPRSGGKGAVLSTAASLVSLLAALGCCLPLGTLLMAAGSAGASIFSEALRPWLVWLSAGFLFVAFVPNYFRSRCEFRHPRGKKAPGFFFPLGGAAAHPGPPPPPAPPPAPLPPPPPPGRPPADF